MPEVLTFDAYLPHNPCAGDFPDVKSSNEMNPCSFADAPSGNGISDARSGCLKLKVPAVRALRVVTTVS